MWSNDNGGITLETIAIADGLNARIQQEQRHSASLERALNERDDLIHQLNGQVATLKAEMADLQDQLRQALIERNEFAAIAQKAVAALEVRK